MRGNTFYQIKPYLTKYLDKNIKDKDSINLFEDFREFKKHIK